MQIRRISVRGFMALESVDIELGRVNVFVGPNGAGKSSLLEAAMIPIFGLARADKKKDWGYMIRAQHRNAEIMLTVGENTGSDTIVHEPVFRINSKSVNGTPIKQPNLFDHILMDPLAFFSLPAKVKADLAGDVSIDRDQLKTQLAKHGLQDPFVLNEVIQIIERYRLAGSEKILAEKRLQATRAVMDPGPAPVFTVDGNKVDLPDEKVLTIWNNNFNGWKVELESARQRLAQLNQQEAEADRQARMVAEAAEVLNTINVPDDFPRKVEMDGVIARLDEARQQHRDLYQEMQNLKGEECPTCRRIWTPGYDDLEAKVREAADVVRSEETNLFQLNQDKASWQARCHEQEIAKAKLKAIQDNPVQAPSKEDMQAAQERITGAEASMLECRKWLDGLHYYRTSYGTWTHRSAEANIAKERREQWDLAVKAVRDPAFKSALVADPIEKARKRLEMTAPIFNLKVDITDEFDVLVWNRPWWLLSNAYRMAASILLADAFAHSRGHRLLKIDGADTLVGNLQRRLVQFVAAVKDSYDTILMALASEEKPAALRALEEASGDSSVHVPYQALANWYWVANGTVSFIRAL